MCNHERQTATQYLLTVSIPFISGQCVIGEMLTNDEKLELFQSPLYRVNV